jgi:hypothetical protein
MLKTVNLLPYRSLHIIGQFGNLIAPHWSVSLQNGNDTLHSTHYKLRLYSVSFPAYHWSVRHKIAPHWSVSLPMWHRYTVQHTLYAKDRKSSSISFPAYNWSVRQINAPHWSVSLQNGNGTLYSTHTIC